jgi:hypothetical protein
MDQLTTEANDTEKALVARSSVFAEQKKLERATWQQVRDALGPQEAAVELTRFSFYSETWGRSPRLLTVCAYRRYPIRLGFESHSIGFWVRRLSEEFLDFVSSGRRLDPWIHNDCRFIRLKPRDRSE